MKHDEEKIDDTVLALLFLTTFSDHGMVRAWKGQSWEVMSRLHAKGLISDPESKAKSVLMTEKGIELSEKLFEKIFLKTPFEEKYIEEIDLLRDLFGSELIAKKLPRVKEIFEHTEAIWEEFVCSIGQTQVRYLLIAEAPPWSEIGVPQYVLDPSSKPRSFMAALRGAFFGTQSISSHECLKEIAAQGFLVLDSIPFAMNFSPKRSSKKYDRLIARTTKSYLQEKIISAKLEWSPNIRIAFAVARNARSILKTMDSVQLAIINIRCPNR